MRTLILSIVFLLVMFGLFAIVAGLIALVFPVSYTEVVTFPVYVGFGLIASIITSGYIIEELNAKLD